MKSQINIIKPNVFILDVDGVLTTGQFLYSVDGKVMKVFGADDNDGLSLLKAHLEIRFITGDKKGFPISKKRIVDDMGFQLEIVSTIRRVGLPKVFVGHGQLRLAGQDALNAKHPQPANHQLIKVALRA